MSTFITAMAVPSVARSDWDNINKHLQKSGDWQMLRPTLVRSVCANQRYLGLEISSVLEYLLISILNDPKEYLTFLDALELAKQEVATWPEGVESVIMAAIATSTSDNRINLKIKAGEIGLKWSTKHCKCHAKLSGTICETKPQSLELKEIHSRHPFN